MCCEWALQPPKGSARKTAAFWFETINDMRCHLPAISRPRYSLRYSFLVVDSGGLSGGGGSRCILRMLAWMKSSKRKVGLSPEREVGSEASSFEDGWD